MMKDTETKMISVILPCGAWYAEPEDFHLYIHVVADGEKKSMVITVAENESDAEKAASDHNSQRKILFTISLIELLEAARKKELAESQK